MKDQERVLSLFFRKDELWEWMMKPWRHGDYIGATDGHAMILIHAPEVALGYPEPGLEIVRVFPKRGTKRVRFSVSKIEEAISHAPSIPVLKCNECGVTTKWPSRDGECCEDCYEGRFIKTKQLQKYPMAQIGLGATAFSVVQLERIVEASKIIGNQVIVLVSESNDYIAHEFFMPAENVRLIQMGLKDKSEIVTTVQPEEETVPVPPQKEEV